MVKKIFHDRYYYGGSIPKSETELDNFAYVRMHENDNKYLNIIERVLVFQANYSSFTERTGIDFYDLMCMDPSTMMYIQNTWVELMRPEQEKAVEQEKTFKKLGDLKKLLANINNKN